MDTIGLLTWAGARVETFRVEILPLVRSSTPRQFLYLTTVGQLKGFGYAWRASLSAHWSAGRRWLVVRRLTAVAWDAVWLRVGSLHVIRDHLRTSYEEQREVVADRAHDIPTWFVGQGETWGNHQLMRDRAASARRRELWSHPDAPPRLVAEAERLMDRYDALAIGDPLPEDWDLAVGKDRRDAAEHEISTTLERVGREIHEAVEAAKTLRNGVAELSEHFARRPL